MKKISIRSQLTLLLTSFFFLTQLACESPDSRLKRQIEKVKKNVLLHQKDLKQTQQDITQMNASLMHSKRTLIKLKKKNMRLIRKSKEADEKLLFVKKKVVFLKKLLAYLQKKTVNQTCLAKQFQIASQIEDIRANCSSHVTQYLHCRANLTKSTTGGLVLGLLLAPLTGGSTLLMAGGGAILGAASSEDCKKKPTCPKMFSRIQANMLRRKPTCSSLGTQPNIDGILLVSPYRQMTEVNMETLSHSERIILHQYLEEKDVNPQTLAYILLYKNLPQDWIESLPIQKIQYLQNTPVALAGGIFSNIQLKQFFANQYWYNPTRNIKKIRLHPQLLAKMTQLKRAFVYKMKKKR